jgi:hypothetical protein
VSELEHEHEFNGPPKRGRIEMCVGYRCTAQRIGTGRRWRDLTAAERTKVTIFMMEQLAVADALRIIHGERWRGHPYFKGSGRAVR